MARKRRRRVSAAAQDPLDAILGDTTGADRVVRFFSEVLRHPKPPFAGQPFILQPWQIEEIIRPIYDPVNERGQRRVRKAYIQTGKKAGKSNVLAGLALYHLFADGEWSGELCSAAGDREQASIIYNLAADMVDFSPVLRERAIVRRAVKKIVDRKTRSTYHALSAEASTKHGPSWSFIAFDELHEQPNRELWDTLTAGMRARRQPLCVAISNAGWDRNSICYEVVDYARRVISGQIEDPAFYARLWEIPEDADWSSEDNWLLANPGLGTVEDIDAGRAFLDIESIRADYRQAKATPAYENTFRRLSCSQWVSQQTRWIPMDKWRAVSSPIDTEALKGRACYGGMDLSSTMDISAVVLAFPDDDGGVAILPHFWIPEERMRERSKRDGVPYEVWTREGLIEATPGNVIDYGFIRARVNDLAGQYQIQELAYDPFNATQLAVDLLGDGLPMVKLRQGFLSLSAPTKELERLVTASLLRHGGNKVLDWMAENAMAVMDAAGNIKLDKARSREKIDGLAATVNALHRLTHDNRKSREAGLIWT